MTSSLPNGFSVRAPTPEDARSVFDLIIACDIADSGEPDYDLDDVKADWTRPHFDLSTDAWLVHSANGMLAAYADLWFESDQVLVNPNSCVHPRYRRQGLGTFILRRAEQWARDHLSEGRLKLQTIILDSNLGARRLMERERFKPVRYDWQMRIDMEAPPPTPKWPQGLMVRTFERGRDEHSFYAVIQESFRDMWNHSDQPYDAWENSILHGNFDPTVSYLVMDGDEPVAATIGFFTGYLNAGWVKQLAVRRAWRKRGIGLALLHQTFSDFYRRGVRRLGLGVDSDNLTGATRLYQRAGMRVMRQFDRYQKEL